jgi:hypothetical protein
MKALVMAVGGVVALLGFGAVALSGRKAIFWLAFIATLVPLEFIDRYYVDLPNGVKWLPEIAIVFAGASALVLAPGARFLLPRALCWVIVAIVAESLLSLYLNRSSVAAFVVAQRGHVMLFASSFALAAVQGIYDRDRVYSAIVGGGVVSAVVCLVERVTIGMTEGDRVTGLFSLGEVVLFYHLVCIGIVLAYWLEGRRVGNWNAGFTVALLVLSLAVGNQEASLPYFVLLFVFLFFHARARRGRLLAIGLVLPVAMLLVFTVIYDTTYTTRQGSFSRAIIEPAYIKRYLFGEREDYLTPGGDLLRGAAILQAYREVASDTPHLLLGRGPGATSESGIAGASGPLAREYPGIGRVTLALLVGEVGLLGVLLYIALLVVVWRSRSEPDRHEHDMVRKVFVLLALAYFVYARLGYEPCFAWLLACTLRREQPPALPGTHPT